MFKNIVLCVLFFLIIAYIIFDSLTVSNNNFNSKKVNFDKNVVYYSNNSNTNKVLSDRFKQSITLEQEQVDSMKLKFNTNNLLSNSPTYQPTLTSVEGTTNINEL